MKKINKTLFFLILSISCLSCGKSYNEQKHLSSVEALRLKTEDSLALKIGVMPTLDCLPLYLAKEHKFFESNGVDIRLKRFTAQMDCDTAIIGGSVNGSITDLIRAERIIRKGTPLNFVTMTNTYWQLFTNRTSRIKELKQLNNKMIAMTRYSATDFLAHYALNSAHLGSNKVFLIQVNDVNVRLNMLMNNEMDAMFLTEPQATVARLSNNPILMDSRDKDIYLGVIAFRVKDLNDSRRKKQLYNFVKAYNKACDSLNINGLYAYKKLIKEYCGVDDKTIKALPKMHFNHVANPRLKDIQRAKKF
jgi:NitT/TauT family transport system substrate-binding protein